MQPVVSGRFSILVYVRDLEKAAAWYRDTLGFTIGPYDYSDFVELHLHGRHVLHLFRDEQAVPLQKPSFYLDTADIELAYQSLKEKGVAVSDLVQRSDHSDFRFTDLEGNVIGITHYPHEHP